MNCATHPELAAVAYCRSCGKALCADCRRPAHGTIYCEEHAPVESPSAPPSAGAVTHGPAGANPAIAFILGWIPGVGAIYNGQYAKGLVHAVIWGILVSITSSDAVRGVEPIFGILITAWMFYMAFEAYHTARKRRAGEAVDEYSSILDLHGRNVPVAGITLIILGVVMLLYTLHLFDFERIARFWPVLLIAAGAYLLYGRLIGGGAQEEVRHERR